MKNIYFTCILLISAFNANCQIKKIDTIGLATTSKFMLLLEFEKSIKEEQFFRDFLETKPTLRFYETEGIENIIFFSLDFISFNDRYFSKADSINKRSISIQYFDSLIFKPIFCFNLKTNDIYRLKGFLRNDFYQFYEALQSQYLRTGIKLNQLNKDIDRGAIFVQGLDLKCLKKSLKYRRKEPDCMESPIFIEKQIGVRW